MTEPPDRRDSAEEPGRAVAPAAVAGRGSFARHRFALAFLAVLALTLFVVPLAKREVFDFRDHFDYFQPLRWFTAEELKAGRLPLWNPYNASGEPWLANPQTGVFYPPAWLHVVLPFETAYMLYLLFHLVLLGWGSYLFFARRAAPGAALVGAAALMFSGPLVSLLDVSNNLATFAWIPLALWCASAGAWRRGGIVLALAFLAGEPFFAAAGAVLYAVVALGGGGRSDDGMVRRVSPALSMGKVAGTALLALGLSAIQLFPFLGFARDSDRAGGTDDAVILADSMPIRDWLRIAVPPRLDGNGLDPKLGQHFIPLVYVGVAVCILALVGLAVSVRRRGSATAAAGWLALLAVAVFLSTGPDILTRLPLTPFRYPARLVPLGAFAIAALAVAGWNAIRADRRWLDLVIIAVILIDLVPRAWPLLRTGGFRTDVVPYASEVGAGTKFVRVGVVDPSRRAAWIACYLNLYDRRFDAFTAAPMVSEEYVRRHRRLLDAPTRQELAKRAIGWVVTAYDLGPSFSPFTRSGDVKVFRNRKTLPMAVLMIRQPPTVVPLHVRFDGSRAMVTVDAAREGVVVLHQQHARGWGVFLDGIETRSLRIGGLFQGLQVTKGHHEIVWRYAPASLRAGVFVTLITLAALALSTFVKWAR